MMTQDTPLIIHTQEEGPYQLCAQIHPLAQHNFNRGSNFIKSNTFYITQVWPIGIIEQSLQQLVCKVN